MLNLRSIDLNLLTVFEAVYEERSQMKAADRLGMTQPAVSLALGRLRYLVPDRKPCFLAQVHRSHRLADAFFE
jgi:predicted transcriptional regulator